MSISPSSLVRFQPEIEGPCVRRLSPQMVVLNNRSSSGEQYVKYIYTYVEMRRAPAPICPLADTRLPLFRPRVSAARRRGRDAKHRRGRDTRYALFRVRSVTRWHVMPRDSTLHSPCTAQPTVVAFFLVRRERSRSLRLSDCLDDEERGKHSFSGDSIKVTGFLTLIRARARVHRCPIFATPTLVSSRTNSYMRFTARTSNMHM